MLRMEFLTPKQGRRFMRPKSPRWTLVACSTLAFVTWFTASAAADDWPQWLGPQRDGIWRENGILKKFPEKGPQYVWRTPIGMGYSGPAVAGGKVYITDRQLAAGAENPENPFGKGTKIPLFPRMVHRVH